MNTVYLKREFLFLKVARIIFDDDLFLNLIDKGGHLMIILISQNKLGVPKGVAVSTKKTVNIDIRKDIGSILSNFNDTTRNEVRRTFNIDNLQFKKEGKISNEVFNIYKKFRRDKKLPLRDKKFLDSANLYSAYYNGEPISFITVYDVKPYLRIQNIFSDTSKEADAEIKKMIGYSTRRLVYEICKYGSKNGYNFLDMAGVNLDDPKKQGITKFKMAFGGDLVDEYTYTYKSPILERIIALKKLIFK